MATPIPNPATYPEIPDKLYFRIGEVSRLAGVKPYVLRYWETEFAGIGPKKSGSNHRLYRRKDVELILEIKHLLYEKRYTIEGARKFMLDQSRNQQVRSEPRPLAKPVQAAVAVSTPMAKAIGGPPASAPSAGSLFADLPEAIMAAHPAPIVSSAPGPASPVNAVQGSGAATASARTAVTASARTKDAATRTAAPAPNLVGSIRRELVSLLELLSP